MRPRSPQADRHRCWLPVLVLGLGAAACQNACLERLPDPPPGAADALDRGLRQGTLVPLDSDAELVYGVFAAESNRFHAVSVRLLPEASLPPRGRVSPMTPLRALDEEGPYLAVVETRFLTRAMATTASPSLASPAPLRFSYLTPLSDPRHLLLEGDDGGGLRAELVDARSGYLAVRFPLVANSVVTLFDVADSGSGPRVSEVHSIVPMNVTLRPGFVRKFAR